jgi:hypothetical protein
MKNQVRTLVATLAMLALVPAYAQHGQRPGGMGMGGPPRGPEFGGSMAKLFGNNTAFTASMEMQSTHSSGEQPLTMPGKICFDNGKSRFEMDMSEMKGAQMPPDAAAQMKAMGMDKMVNITLPEKKAHYLVYPNMQAYAEMPIQNPEAAKAATDFNIEITELGKETLDGHPCVKNKAVVTDKQGVKHESTVWNATDLKNFPIKIESTEEGHKTTMVFRNVKLEKPEASLFEPPSDCKKYDNIMSLMMQRAMGGRGPAMGMPPGHE